MVTKTLKTFIISLLAFNVSQAYSCMSEPSERWYMYSFGSPEFSSYFQEENLKYWNGYCNSEEPFYYAYMPAMKKAANAKNDAPMLSYLNALEQYLNVADELSRDSWDYPTAEQLAKRKQTLTDILSTCRQHRSGQLADRWLLLEMRANMMSGNYSENVALWRTRGEKASAGYVKEMMRNVYANALLNTGDKVGAWNIYAGQNDNQSLLWSARKYTNLAGIKELHSRYPDAPVHKFLLEKYVNSVQDVVDMYNDNLHHKLRYVEEPDIYGTSGTGWDEAYAYYWNDISGKAYAQIDKDYMKEITEFIAFSDSVARLKATVNPCMWETASALCSYFLGYYAQARERIGNAMAMNADRDTKDMARRIRMLIATSSDDIASSEFKSFITKELAWLDGEIEKKESNILTNARDRILNLGLARNYEGQHNCDMTRLVALCRDYVRAHEDYVLSSMTQDIYPNKSADIMRLFSTLRNPGNDPLAQYVASKVVLSDDFKNDILGTKLLQEGKWEQALPYLKRVSMRYLNSQAIAFYAARRNYKIPAWNGFQTVGDNNYEETQKPVSLQRNVKVDFCNDMIRLANEAKTATQRRKERIALEEAVALYQASRFGQCWYIAQYGFSNYEEHPVAADELAGKAIARLHQCEKSADPKVRAAALFALVYAAPDKWKTEEWDWSNDKLNLFIHRNSAQYAALNRLNNFLAANPSARLPEISRCDVLKQWRKYE